MNGFSEFRQAVEALTDPVPPAFAREFQVSTVHAPLPDGFLDRAVAESLKLPAGVWHALMAGMADAGPPTALGDHEIPTLLVWGDRDAVFPRAEQDALLALLRRGATLVVYPETGHAVHWERPVEFVRDLAAFVGTR
jgi:pimeloyl-ACP methyl ester carboxylesterase